MSNPTPPVVVITDTANCYVNGQNVGQPADAIANNPALAPAIQTALVAFVAKTVSDAQAAIAAAQAEADAKVAAALAPVEAVETPATPTP